MDRRNPAFFASGRVRFDPRLRTIISDNPAPRIPEELLFQDRIVETTDVIGATQGGPIVAMRLSDCPVGEGVWEAIARLDSLRTLKLDSLPGSVEGFQVPRSVEELGLREVDIEDWEMLARLPQLTRLSISDTQLSQSAFLGISRLTTLESLQLEDARFHTCAIPNLVQLQNLRSLSLARSDVDDASVAMFARLPNLRRVSLSDTKISREGLQVIARSTSIEELDLTGADLDPETLIALGQMTRLRTLQLSCVDARVLRILLGIPHLQSVYVRNKAGEVEGPYSPDEWLKKVGGRDCPRCFDREPTTVG